MDKKNKRLLFVINVDWYFLLHWLDRAVAARNAGYDVHVAIAITEPANIAKIESFGFSVHVIPVSRKGLNPLQEINTFLAIFRVLRDCSPDLIHSVTIKPNVYTGFLAKFFRWPLVANVPGLGTLFTKDDWLSSLSQKVFLSFYKFCFDRRGVSVFFENKEDMHCLEQFRFKRGEIALIAGAGVDIKRYCVLPEPDGSVVKVLFAARLYRNKGLYELVAAVDLLRARGLAVELLVAGILDDDTFGAIPESQLVDWHRTGKIIWLGQVHDMPVLIGSSHIVCQPSITREGLPRIILEALSCGRPVVTTNVPGCREVVTDEVNGLLVEAGDVEALADAIGRLVISRHLRYEYALSGRKLIEQGYSSDHVIAETLAAYRRTIS